MTIIAWHSTKNYYLADTVEQAEEFCQRFEWQLGREPMEILVPLSRNTSSIEQLCRDLLEQALKDDLVLPNHHGPYDLSAGDLVGMVNMLNGRMH